MLFTALHQALGEPPGPLTSAMLDAAIAEGVVEQDGLDWKSALPEERALRDSDLVKDIAAFANSGGRAKEAGRPPGAPRKAPGKLVEGSVIQGWKAALGELSLIYPDRINNHL